MNFIIIPCEAIVLIVSIGFILTAWKMFVFRTRLHKLISNAKWEKTLEKKGIYKNYTIVFFGDSQIALWWMCPFFGLIPIRNRGISGELAGDAVRRFQHDALDYNPDLIFVLTGANDLTNGRDYKDVAEDIAKMVLMAKNKSKKIIIGSLLPSGKGIFKSSHLSEINLLNWRINEICDKYKIEFIDFHSILSDSNGFFNLHFTDDGIHPNFNGYFLMSDLLLNRLVNLQ